MTKLRATINGLDEEETFSYVSNRDHIEKYKELISVASIVRKSRL